MPRFADILLPLALPSPLTYILPSNLQQVAVGQRVVVPLGKKRIYTGIVVSIHDKEPEPGLNLKAVEAAEDEKPLVLPQQLSLWKWMADYYMCTLGEVMKAALPSGLKLESETVVTLSDDADVDLLEGTEALVARAIGTSECSLDQLRSKLPRTGVLSAVRRLLDRRVICVREALNRHYKPRTETHVRLAAEYFDNQRLNELFSTLSRTPKQEQLLLRYLDLAHASAALALHNASLLKEVSKKALLRAMDSSEYALTALRSKGILETYAYEIGRLATPQAIPQLAGRPLSTAQQRAYHEIDRILWADGPQHRPVCLLHGITGSGKTEIYIQLIRRELAAGRQVLYMLPEIALTTQITTRLGRVFGEQMGVYHSKFPDAERVEVWRRQMSEKPFALILGVRSSLFLPYRNLGLIIVDEEHEASYKQQDPAPRYHGRDAALVLAQKCGARVLLGTATPSVAVYRRALEGKYGLVKLEERYGQAQLPTVVVEDVKELRRKKLMKTPFSPRLIDEMRKALGRHEQIILFQNRRGYAPVLTCRTCGWSPRCTRCDVALTYHQRDRKLVCHYCGAAYDVPTQCPNCGDTELRDVGYGTEKIEEAVTQLFPQARTSRMDLDTTRSRTAYENIIEDFQQGHTDVLIGTQMVTKGLDFGRVSLVGILNADQGLNVPDFRAFERTYQMLSQVAGRAGRREAKGMVVLQTQQVELPLIRQIVETDYEGMYADQIEEREIFRYPPFCRIINIYLRHRQDSVNIAAAQALAQMLRPYFGANLLGPERPVVGRVHLFYIQKFLLKVDPSLSPSGVRRTLTAAREALMAIPQFRNVMVHFDVDPQ